VSEKRRASGVYGGDCGRCGHRGWEHFTLNYETRQAEPFGPCHEFWFDLRPRRSEQRPAYKHCPCRRFVDRLLRSEGKELEG
jgi:hypothetical protein